MYFKKCIGYLLALFLLVSQSGMAITVHYCGGEVESVKTSFPLKEKKGCCGKPEKKPAHCCKDQLVKADKETPSVVKTLTFSAECCEFCAIDFNPEVGVVYQDIQSSSISTSAHQIHGPPLYLLYSQYIFYA